MANPDTEYAADQRFLEDRRLDFSRMTQEQYNGAMAEWQSQVKHFQGLVEDMKDDWPHYKNYLAAHEPNELGRIQNLYEEWRAQSHPEYEYMFAESVRQ